jgi:hypothetical protein
MTFWERLQTGCLATGQLPPTKAELAAFLNVGRSAITKYEQGGFPKQAHANKIGRRWKLRTQWLQSGQGEMVAEELMDEADLEALKTWRSLSQDAKERIMAAMRYEQAASTSASTARHKALTDEIIQQIDRKHGRSTNKPLKQ